MCMFFFSSRRRHTRCALVTGVQTCALPICKSHLARAIDALVPLRDTLLAARKQRPQPARDEKIVLADNALAILGLVQAGQALHDPALIQAADRKSTRLNSSH